MRIVLLEPFMGGSHALWAEGLIRHSRHDIELISLPGRHWKWRMHGAAPEFARKFNQLSYKPELVLATDLMDVAVFSGLARQKLQGIPLVIYFHENQLCYPWSDRDPDTKSGRNRHYAFINLQSALAANRVLFSSEYQRKTFLEKLPEFLNAFPDFQLKWAVESITKKSGVLPLGLNLGDTIHRTANRHKVPVILWNHRWEYDKNPDLFFNTLFKISAANIEFELIVCGEQYGESPGIFKQAREILKENIIHWGYCESKEEYQSLLEKSDIVPVSSNQDFFGISVIEAVWHGALPLLPNRLAYPEIFGESIPYYESDEQFVERLIALIRTKAWLADNNSQPDYLKKYRWSEMIQHWDNTFESVVLQ